MVTHLMLHRNITLSLVLAVFLPSGGCLFFFLTGILKQSLRLSWHGLCEGLQVPKVLASSWDVPLTAADPKGTIESTESHTGLDLGTHVHLTSKMMPLMTLKRLEAGPNVEE